MIYTWTEISNIYLQKFVMEMGEAAEKMQTRLDLVQDSFYALHPQPLKSILQSTSRLIVGILSYTLFILMNENRELE